MGQQNRGFHRIRSYAPGLRRQTMERSFFDDTGRHQGLVEWAYWPITQALSALLQADSVVMEFAHRNTPIPAWEPYSWEFTSAASMLVCIWLIVLFDRRFPLDSERIGRHLVVLSWTRDGLAGYEFKRGGHAGPAPADYERPVHAGLLGGPSSG